MAMCRICNNEITSQNRVKSHILTRSQYVSPLTVNTKSQLLDYGDGRKFNPTHEMTDNKILCSMCDSMLGRYEDERGRLLQVLADSDFQYNNSLKIIDNMNGLKIKLACLADLLRCSVTSIASFRSISLGERHENKIIQILKNPSICSAKDYPTIIFKCKTPFEITAVQLPLYSRVNGLVFYRTMMPYGWLWMTKVDSVGDNVFEKLSVDCVADSAQIVDCGDSAFIKAELLESYRLIDSIEHSRK